MASVQALAEYEEDRLEAIEDLKEDGFLGQFGTDYSEDDDRESLTPYFEVCEEYYFQLENTDNFKSEIQTTDQAFIVSNQSNGALSGCCFMESQGKAIVEIQAFPEGLDNPIYYEILVRG